MKILKTLLKFLFGKEASIFDENSRIFHKLSSKKWEQWQNRYKTDPEYNWRNHTGIKAN